MKNNVKLRPLNINDLQGMQEWMTDKECKKWFQFPEEYVLAENIEKFIHNASIEIKNGESVHWAISSLEGEFRNHISTKDRICSIKWYAMLKDEYELKIKKDSEK